MVLVTLNQLKQAMLPLDAYEKILLAVGSDIDEDTGFPLYSLLDIVNPATLLNAVSDIPGMLKYEDIWRKFSAWCAFQNVHKIEEFCTKKEYELLVNYLLDGDEKLRGLAEEAANRVSDFTWDYEDPSIALVVMRIAWSIGWQTSESAVKAAAWAASESAAIASNDSRTELVVAAQEKRLRELLTA